MNSPTMILSECHPPCEEAAEVVYRVVTAWLTRELRKSVYVNFRCNGLSDYNIVAFSNVYIYKTS